MATTRERLLACAADAFAAGGPQAVTMRAVGSAAGLSPMAVYRHFRGRDDLLRAVGEDAFAAWERRVARVRARAPLAWLRAVFDAYLAFALREPRRFEAAFLLGTRVERRYPHDFARSASPAGTLVVARIREAQERGQLDRTPALEIGLALWAQAHGLVVLFRSGRFTAGQAAFARIYRRSLGHVLGRFLITPQRRRA